MSVPLCHCGRPATNGKYCSHTCAPFGHLSSQRHSRPELKKVIPPGKLSAKELSARLGITDSQIYIYARAGKIPFEKSHETGYVFELSAVKAALALTGYKPRPRRSA